MIDYLVVAITFEHLNGAALVLLVACVILCVLAAIYLWRLNDEDEWKASSLRHSASIEDTARSTSNASTLESSAESSEPPRSRFQRFVEYPVFLGYVGFALGVLIPALLILITLGDWLEDTRYELVVFYGGLLIWNICFTQLFKFRLKIPVLPIPISWVALPFALLGLWDLCFGSY